MDALRDSILATAQAIWASTALLVALAVPCGMLLGAQGFLPPAPTLIAAMAVALVAAAVGRQRRHVWLPGLLLAALALGLWRYAATRPSTGPDGLPYYIGRPVTLTGSVAAEPELLDRGENLRVSVDTLATGSTARRVSGLVLVHLGAIASLAYGDRLSLAGDLASPPILPGGSPGAYRAYLAAQGITTVMNYPRLQQLGTGSGNPLLALAIWLRDLLVGGIRRILPGPEATLLLGILLGTRTRALGTLTAPFIATGMIHVVAIDGFKISLVTGMTYALSRRLLRVRRPFVLPLAVLLLYVLLTGATPAGLRAALMWTLALVALRFGRRADVATSLALAAALLALASPRILWDLGFQFSLFGTAGIVLLAPGLERWLRRLPAVVREPIVVTLAAQVATLPLQIAGFGQVSLVATLANTLLLLLLGPIIALGAPAALAGALLPPLGQWLGFLVYPFLAAMIAAVQSLARLPLASLPMSPWPLPPVAGYYVLLGLAAWRIARTGGMAASPGTPSAVPTPAGSRLFGLPPAWALSGSVALLLATVAWQVPRPLYTLALLPLGKGQGLLLTTPAGRAILIDGGTAPSRLDAALGDRLPFWRSRLDLVVLSDVDQDHYSGPRNLDSGGRLKT